MILQIEPDPERKRIALKPAAVLQKNERTSYTKRMAASDDGRLFLAQTSGKVLRAATDGGQTEGRRKGMKGGRTEKVSVESVSLAGKSAAWEN